MITADLIAIGAGALFILLGALLGFSRGLKFFTGGIFGKIISVVITYFLFGIVLSWSFVQNLLADFITMLQNNGGWICKVLLFLRIELIVFAVVLYILVRIAKKIVVGLVAGIFSSENRIIKVINKLLGIILFAVMFVVIGLIVLQIASIVGGTDGNLYQSLVGSGLGLDKLFLDNPLNYIISSIKR